MESVPEYKSVWCHRSQNSTICTLSKRWRMASSLFLVLLFCTQMLENQDHMLVLIEYLVIHPYTRHWEPHVSRATVFFPKESGNPGKNPNFIITLPTIVPSSPPASLFEQNMCYVFSLPLLPPFSTQNIVDPASRGQCPPPSLPRPLPPPLSFYCWSTLVGLSSVVTLLTILPHRTFLWFLVFLLPCWLPLFSFPNRLFSIYP